MSALRAKRIAFVDRYSSIELVLVLIKTSHCDDLHRFIDRNRHARLVLVGPVVGVNPGQLLDLAVRDLLDV